MGLIANVYRTTGRDCSLLGWSSKHDRVIITNASGPFDPEKYPEYEAVRIVKHRTMHTVHAVSEKDLASGRWTMFGGNLLSCSDSRFGELIAEILGEQYQYAVKAVAIHDRIE